MTAILMVLGVSVLAAMYWNRNLTVDELTFKGNYFTETEVLETTAAINFGIKPDSLDLDALKARIEAIDYVKLAVPFVQPDGELEIRIEERLPIGLLMDGSERSYVDAEGVRLPVIPGKTVDLPLVYGFSASGQDTLQSKAFGQIRDFLISSRINEFGWTTISEVAYSPEEGVVALSRENGVKLIFGDNEFDIKLENWEAFYTEIIRVKGIHTMNQVDLRFTNQVVTRES